MPDQGRNEEELAEARRRVADVFDALGIPYEIVIHPPIFSAAERAEKQVEVDGLICKNLFLRNKDKSKYYLYTLPIDKRADLVALQKALGETRLSFGDAEALWEMLHIQPGSVSLLNIIGAREMRPITGDANHGDGPFDRLAYQKVRPRDWRPRDWSTYSLKFLVDAEVLKETRIGVHPNDNAATIVFPPDRLTDIFGHYGVDFEFISL